MALTGARDANGRNLRYDCSSPGHYRVATWRRGKVWVMTNHVNVEAGKG